MLATAETLSTHHESREQVTQSVGLRITELLGLDSCRFVPGPQPNPEAPTFDHSGALVREGHRLNVERNGLPVDSTMYLPIRSAGQVRGHFVLTAATHVARPTVDQRRVAALLADQVAGWLNFSGHQMSADDISPSGHSVDHRGTGLDVPSP